MALVYVLLCFRCHDMQMACNVGQPGQIHAPKHP